jgi:hypothetical protein
VEKGSITGHVLSNVPMLSVKGTGVSLRIMTQSKAAMVHEGGDEVTWTAGTLVAAFGRGSFAAKSMDKVELDKEVPFLLESSTSEVIFNGELTTVGAVLQKKMETDPTAFIAYHKVVEEPGKDDFKLTQTASVVFVPKNKVNIEADGGEEGEGAVALQASAAAMIECNKWNGKHTKVLWTLTWKPPRGFMPQRPQVVLSDGGKIVAGKALELI